MSRVWVGDKTEARVTSEPGVALPIGSQTHVPNGAFAQRLALPESLLDDGSVHKNEGLHLTSTQRNTWEHHAPNVDVSPSHKAMKKAL